MIEKKRPRHVILTVGGGTQERLGLYLKRNLSYLPAIHCIGAAIAFLSGDQVKIPVWADRIYLGWLYRSISDPKRYVPRYWEARKLLYILYRYRERLPVAAE
jgi:UDP-N-acetyl-D-mannosaminuronic acid transferase (WecB/TagA/CpsF family)